MNVQRGVDYSWARPGGAAIAAVGLALRSCSAEEGATYMSTATIEKTRPEVFNRPAEFQGSFTPVTPAGDCWEDAEGRPYLFDTDDGVRAHDIAWRMAEAGRANVHVTEVECEIPEAAQRRIWERVRWAIASEQGVALLEEAAR